MTTKTEVATRPGDQGAGSHKCAKAAQAVDHALPRNSFGMPGRKPRESRPEQGKNVMYVMITAVSALFGCRSWWYLAARRRAE
jgi:hypothetical protein